MEEDDLNKYFAPEYYRATSNVLEVEMENWIMNKGMLNYVLIYIPTIPIFGQSKNKKGAISTYYE
ncbi:hypothetical protein BMQ_pBM70085 (plasmid) [Priestia megaterium QM B1551]|uniref:Uncharacterized protein n=1 Tax=Priestia megaterium (strain ATCC 12872 / QMB1551) TaxID=545693 RepID=D5E4A2_PRIM1|nr:hypothetical protein BMQ_pBM70085 [Priestia megaterium QM B1551]MDF2014233.1 hypothetical protein [Priestia megaterium]